jgi:hypothetical protein
MVAMLRNIADPASVGPAMAITLIGAMFAVFVAEIIVAPLWFRIAASHAPVTGTETPRRSPVPLALPAVLFLRIISMLLLFVALGWR